MPFNNVNIDFFQDKWECLDSAERALHRDVMLEDNILVSVGENIFRESKFILGIFCNRLCLRNNCQFVLIVVTVLYLAHDILYHSIVS